jgi:hypothetical protein
MGHFLGGCGGAFGGGAGALGGGGGAGWTPGCVPGGAGAGRTPACLLKPVLSPPLLRIVDRATHHCRSRLMDAPGRRPRYMHSTSYRALARLAASHPVLAR